MAVAVGRTRSAAGPGSFARGRLSLDEPAYVPIPSRQCTPKRRHGGHHAEPSSTRDTHLADGGVWTDGAMGRSCRCAKAVQDTGHHRRGGPGQHYGTTLKIRGSLDRISGFSVFVAENDVKSAKDGLRYHDQQHGGAITVESEVGEFTEFVVTIRNRCSRGKGSSHDCPRVGRGQPAT
jgi:hypothetical protein